MKKCTKCGIEKPLTEFSVRKYKGHYYYQSWCKSCFAEYKREHHKRTYTPRPRIKPSPQEIAERKHRAYKRRYLARRDKVLQYYKDNPEITIASNANHRAKIHNAPGRLTKEDIIDIRDRYGWRCANCGSYDNVEFDHVKPLSEGGANTVDNLQLLCKSCNIRKGTRTIRYEPYKETSTSKKTEAI